MAITKTAVTREDLWRAFRHTHDVRRRERYPSILLLIDGKSCPEMAPWLYRDEETVRKDRSCSSPCETFSPVKN